MRMRQRHQYAETYIVEHFKPVYNLRLDDLNEGRREVRLKEKGLTVYFSLNGNIQAGRPHLPK